jgi:hypothetical protein
MKIVHAAVFAIATLAAAGCSRTGGERAGTAAVAASGVSDDAGRLHGYVVARKHGDFRMHDGKEQRLEVDYGWDYDTGTAYRRTFDEQGNLLEKKEMVGAELVLTEVEIERVRALVRTHPALRSIVDKPDVVIWAGGFVYRKPGDPHCDRGSRCIHAIAADDHGDNAIAHAIVDLQTDRVVYPFYQPSADEVVGTH